MSIKNLLERASKAYYEGNPIMEDFQFDELAHQYNWNQVGYSPTGKVFHKKRLRSLQKVFAGSGKNPLNSYPNSEIIETPKLDGACISLLYKEGLLVQALTRGDGIEGVDITDKIFNSKLVSELLSNVCVEWVYSWIQVTGEVVAPKNIPNSRNYAAGALNLKDNKEFDSRDLSFIAYDFQCEIETEGEYMEIYGNRSKLYEDDMYVLGVFGFDVITDSEWEEFPHDGRVFRLNDNKEFTKLGYTSPHPRGAYALKEQQEIQQTILKDVIWQVGKSGQVSPVAILEPVKIGGATVSRATLHNIAYIEDLGLEIGSRVKIIRSGEIIPRIVGVIEK